MKLGNIQHDVPVPTTLRGEWNKRFSTMQIGDSFIVYPEDDEDLQLIANRIGSIRRKYEIKLGTKYITKRTNRLKPGIRIWRTV
jgi:uncharacterized protein YxjI